MVFTDNVDGVEERRNFTNLPRNILPHKRLDLGQIWVCPQIFGKRGNESARKRRRPARPRSEARRGPPLLGQRDGPWCQTHQGPVFSALFTLQEVGVRIGRFQSELKTRRLETRLGRRLGELPRYWDKEMDPGAKRSRVLFFSVLFTPQ